MSSHEPERRSVRTRREPPRFRDVEVRRVEPVSPRLRRITLTGPELEGFAVPELAASVRVLLPPAPRDPLVIPAWNGNEFLLADGRRPTIRTFTPRRVDLDALELDLDAVIHGNGPASVWAAAAEPGNRVAISGPGRGYAIDSGAPAFLLVGDETAIPAISQLLEAIPVTTPVRVLIEVATADAHPPMPQSARAVTDWYELPAGAAPGDALVAAVRAEQLVDGVLVWAAGEAAAMQRIRRYLFDERAIPRARTVIRGYWKLGRAGADEA